MGLTPAWEFREDLPLLRPCSQAGLCGLAYWEVSHVGFLCPRTSPAPSWAPHSASHHLVSALSSPGLGSALISLPTTRQLRRAGTFPVTLLQGLPKVKGQKSSKVKAGSA